MSYYAGRRLAAAFLAALLTTALLFLLVKTLDYSTRPSFCTRCHEGKVQYLLWTVSSHSRVGCLDCHRRPGALGVVEQNLRALTNVYIHLTGVQPKTDGSGFNTEIPDANCLQCHTIKRTVTPGGDLIIPHRSHVENQEARCIDCHKNMVHGQEGRKAAEKLEDTVSVEQARAVLLEQLTPKDFRPDMGTCLRCHNGAKAPNKCQACHKKIITPDNHQAGDWRVKHGPAARLKVSECVYCHALAVGKQSDGKDVEKLSLHEAVRYNDFCSQCHTKRPPSHIPDWKFLHREKAKTDAEGCLACHPKEEKKGAEEVVVACSKCHANAHEDRWLQRHPQVVKEEGIRKCFSCHGPNNCSNCHTQRAAGLLK